ncbi:MAG TPA: ABC transporter ATP-binding protein [Phototrophicaceae bacterium]|nr:ABC transporter ATP-binding protein [Phototrophicaceae bacterium]
MSDQPILEARNLTKHFVSGSAFSRRVVRALVDFNARLYPGHVTALVGESGSGKSTAARLLSRLYEPTSGDILYEGKSILKEHGRGPLLAYRSQVQMIFQDPFSSLNQIHSVEYHLQRPLQIHHKTTRKTTHAQVLDLLHRVALDPPEDYAFKYPHQLSGGQRQRVAIARALAVEPKIMLADEPISMLDVSIRIGILNLMAKLRDEDNIAFLFVTHDLASARYFADETMVMYAGRTVESGSSEELIRNPQHPYTQLLLSAVPDPARGLRTQEVQVKGEVPIYGAVGQGCPFAARCPFVMSKCRETMPPVTQLSDSRWVRCYLYGENAPKQPEKVASAN